MYYIYLFPYLQEANNMVQEANVKRMHSEKLLEDANNKVRYHHASL